MKDLVLPVPETMSAIYIVPVPAPITTVEARQQAGKAVEARPTGPPQPPEDASPEDRFRSS
jgi:hypothetical protein